MNKVAFSFLILLFQGQSLLSQDRFEQEGIASYYADKFEGKTTANGEIYQHNQMTAAHLSLPFGSWVEVVNLENQKKVKVRINDRGPFVKGRIIDLSKEAARQLDFIPLGLTDVRIRLLSEEESRDNAAGDLNREGSIGDDAKGDSPQRKLESGRFFNLQIEEVDPSGFGVQVGSFVDLVNVMQMVEKLGDEFKGPLTVEAGEVNNTRIYRIILGQFGSRSQAERLQRRMLDQFPDCFIYIF